VRLDGADDLSDDAVLGIVAEHGCGHARGAIVVVWLTVRSRERRTLDSDLLAVELFEVRTLGAREDLGCVRGAHDSLPPLAYSTWRSGVQLQGAPVTGSRQNGA
jgi:hypothetical protein